MNRSFRGTGLTGLLIILGLATGACGKKPAEAAPAPAVMASQPAPARNAVRSDPGSTTDAAAEAARRRAVLTEMVFFDYDRAVIRPDQRALLDAKVQVLRQDPDVVLIGEMRDHETVEAALRIAETGHLTFATLHTNSAAQTINRIIDIFPAHQQGQIRVQLSFVLEGILCQSLLPRASGNGRALAMEVLVPSSAIRNLIREDKIHQIYGMMQTGQAKHGMQTFNQSLANLYFKRMITLQTAIARSSHADELQEMIARGSQMQGVPVPASAARTARR